MQKLLRGFTVLLLGITLVGCSTTPTVNGNKLTTANKEVEIVRVERVKDVLSTQYNDTRTDVAYITLTYNNKGKENDSFTKTTTIKVVQDGMERIRNYIAVGEENATDFRNIVSGETITVPYAFEIVGDSPIEIYLDGKKWDFNI